MAAVVKVSEEFTNRSQSWCFQGIYRNASGLFEVGVRRNAYADQSHANISVWGVNGWHHFCSLPIEHWYDSGPSYTKRELTSEDEYQFVVIRDTLLSKLAFGLWSDPKVIVTGEGV